MADLESRIITKCSGFRNGQQFRSWSWCILTTCLISLPYVYSLCLDIDITVSLYPQGDIIIPYGQSLVILCTAGKNYSSNDLEFYLGMKHIESEIVNGTTRKLYIKKPEKQLMSYYCWNNKSTKLCVGRVLVDSPPADVTNFNCLWKNLDIFNCSWTPPESYTKVNYSVALSVNDNNVTSPCINYASKTKEKTNYCVWDTHDQQSYWQQAELIFLHLTAYNIFGSNSQNFTIDHFSIIKPDPPIDLRVIKKFTHNVVLRWNVPYNIFDFLRYGVDHIIEYQIAKIDKRTELHRVDTSMLPPKNKTYSFHLTNLPYAHMLYEVRVYIKTKKAVKRDYWSDFGYTMFYTASEEPKKPPDMVTGAFDQATYSNSRIIYVYWKQIEEYEEAGPNFTYKVLVSEKNKTKTLFADKNNSLSFVKLNVTLDELEVTVWSYNINGSSLNSSHLYIPPEKDTHALKPMSFTKLASENGTYELSWLEVKNIDNYTLFWCQHNRTKICTDRMDFAILKPNTNSHMINLPREYRYQFAIAANKGRNTSGMVWEQFDIYKDKWKIRRK